jgi:hypothetical protein
MPNPTRAELHALLKDAICGPDFARATFAGAARGASTEWVRVVVRPVEVRGARHVQFAYHGAKKVLTKNFEPDAIDDPLEELLLVGFAGVHVSSLAEELDVRTSRKGKVHIGRSRAQLSAPASAEHNRAKDVPLPEGRASHLLEVLGISTADGTVRPTMRAKFTQINEFLKHLSHALDDTELARLNRPVELLDCGCGLSYLTLAAHHYLNDVRDIPARVVGVDVNDEVIRKSAERAERAAAGSAEFACRRIGTADLVIALHACDTATDDAIAQAIRSEAQLLLCVPCCHHDLNRALGASAGDGVLRPVLRHGILLQRTADLITDAFRALALRICGYRTDVVEFVATEHTPRNLMIRAARGAPAGDAALVSEYQEMKRFWRVTPYIEKALGERFQQLVRA